MDKKEEPKKVETSLTKDELTILSNVLVQLSVKVSEAPQFIALSNKLLKMATEVDLK